MEDYGRRRGFFFPLVLIGLGVLLLLVNTGRITGTTWENLAIYWPVILIIGGLDGLWRRDGLVWSLVMLGLGGILLLGNLGYLAVRALPLLARIWPILLVAIGLDIAFRGHWKGWQVILRALLGILLVAGIFWLAVAFSASSGTRQATYQQEKGQAVTSDMSFEFPVGDLVITPATDQKYLVNGTAKLPNGATLTPAFNLDPGGASTLKVGVEAPGVLWGGISFYQYAFSINPSIPIKLHNDLAVGNMQLDLATTMVSSVESNIAVGIQKVYLPCNDGLTGRFDIAVGGMDLYLPKNCDVTIHLEGAPLNVTLPAGYQRSDSTIRSTSAPAGSNSIEINISVAVGSLGVHSTQ